MGEIKSAAEIAREKIARLGETTEEERIRWKYAPEGEELAARYLKKDCNLTEELGRFDDKAKAVVARVINDILLRNIALPRNEVAGMTNSKAMDGLKAVKQDKAAVENVLTKIRQIFEHYTQHGEQQKQQAYQALKKEFEDKIQQAMMQKTGVNTRINIDVEKQPQFMEEWRRLQARLEGQYLQLLDEYKQELAAVK